MAVTHAKPGEIIDFRPLGTSLAATKTTTLFKTEHVEVIHIVMPTGKEISKHEVTGEIIIQCLQGRIAFTAAGKTEKLGAGQMIYLEAKKSHAVRCIEDASFLLTILLNR